MSPVSLSTTILAYSVGVVLVNVSMTVMSDMACCAARHVHSVMEMDVSALLVCCCAFILGQAWSAMMLDECLVGVAQCACRAPHLLVLWECGTVAEGCCVLLGMGRVAVVCALRLVAAHLCRRWPALVVACPCMRGGCWPPVTMGFYVTWCKVVGLDVSSDCTSFVCGGATLGSATGAGATIGGDSLGGAAALACGGGDWPS
jgi:hypothetical protein